MTTLPSASRRAMLKASVAVIAVTPSGSFALARTRVLDGNGHPLPAAEIRESGPGGERTVEASADTAFASLGGLPGNHAWRFSFFIKVRNVLSHFL